MIFPPKFPLVWSSRLSRRINFVKWNWHQFFFSSFVWRVWLQYHSENGIFCFENRMQSIKNVITLTFAIFAFPSKVLRHRRTKPCSILAYLFYLEKNHLSNGKNVIESIKGRRVEKRTAIWRQLFVADENHRNQRGNIVQCWLLSIAL